MAKIIGNVKPEDEYTHPLGSETNFNESMYFNFFDQKEAIGGFIRLGNRANEGRAEMTVTLYLPDGRVLGEGSFHLWETSDLDGRLLRNVGLPGGLPFSPGLYVFEVGMREWRTESQAGLGKRETRKKVPFRIVP